MECEEGEISREGGERDREGGEREKEVGERESEGGDREREGGEMEVEVGREKEMVMVKILWAENEWFLLRKKGQQEHKLVDGKRNGRQHSSSTFHHLLDIFGNVGLWVCSKNNLVQTVQIVLAVATTVPWMIIIEGSKMLSASQGREKRR